jgi:hypothetical protein
MSPHSDLYVVNRIAGVMVSMFDSSAIYRRFEARSGQTKDYGIGIWCFSAKHAILRRKRKDWVAQNQDNCLTPLSTIVQLYRCGITTNVVSLNPAHGLVYSIQHYVIKFIVMQFIKLLSQRFLKNRFMFHSKYTSKRTAV